MHMGAGDSSVVRMLDSWSKGRGVARIFFSSACWFLVLGLLGKNTTTGRCTAVCSSMLHVITHIGTGDSSVVRTLDSWSKGRGFESRQELWENFLLQYLPVCWEEKQIGNCTAMCSSMLHVITHMGAGDSSVVRTLDSWSKGRGFESWQEQWENFLLQYLLVLGLLGKKTNKLVTVLQCVPVCFMWCDNAHGSGGQLSG